MKALLLLATLTACDRFEFRVLVYPQTPDAATGLALLADGHVERCDPDPAFEGRCTYLITRTTSDYDSAQGTGLILQLSTGQGTILDTIGAPVGACADAGIGTIHSELIRFQILPTQTLESDHHFECEGSEGSLGGDS